MMPKQTKLSILGLFTLRFETAFRMVNCYVNTTMLEVFHVVKIDYLPKKTCFSIDKIIAGTRITALDYNHNVNRQQVSIIEILFDFARIEVHNKQDTEEIQYFLQFN